MEWFPYIVEISMISDFHSTPWVDIHWNSIFPDFFYQCGLLKSRSRKFCYGIHLLYYVNLIFFVKTEQILTWFSKDWFRNTFSIWRPCYSTTWNVYVLTPRLAADLLYKSEGFVTRLVSNSRPKHLCFVHS